MLRRDGNYKFYCIQHLWERREESKWAFSGYVEWAEQAIGDWKGASAFSACGEVWQSIGVHGTHDQSYALALCSWLSHNKPEHRFRVVLCQVTQKVTEEVLFA